jgi:hypothetical protein
MRSPISKERAESRVVNRYHKLHQPLIELIQSLHDLVPQGMVIGGTIELTQVDGYIEISQNAKPIRLVINDGDKRLTIVMQDKRPGL